MSKLFELLTKNIMFLHPFEEVFGVFHNPCQYPMVVVSYIDLTSYYLGTPLNMMALLVVFLSFPLHILTKLVFFLPHSVLPLPIIKQDY